MSCQHTMTLGVYLLGALDPAERAAFESHLSFCDLCRGELVRLAPLPGLLNQITPQDFADDLPPIGVEGGGGVAVAQSQPITEPVPIPVQRPLPPADEYPARGNRPKNKPSGRPGGEPRPPRRWRVASAALAVAVLAVAAVFGWQAVRHDPAATPSAEGVVWSAASEDGTAHAEARLIDREWGTEIQLKIDGLPPDRECYVMVYDHYGKRQVGGWWGTDHDPAEEIPASTSYRRSKIDRLEFLLDDRSVALTVEAPD